MNPLESHQPQPEQLEGQAPSEVIQQASATEELVTQAKATVANLVPEARIPLDRDLRAVGGWRRY